MISNASSPISSLHPESLPSLTVHLLGRRITCMTIPDIIQAIHLACKTRSRLTIGSCNIHSFNMSTIHPWFFGFLQNTSIVMCDGMGILKAIEFMGYKLPLAYRVSYTDLMPHVLQLCHQHHCSVFLLGAAQDHLSGALDNLSTLYPGLSITGHHGFFNMHDAIQNQAVIDAINAANPDVLIIGMGNPRQEEWVYHFAHKLNARVIMMGGAVIKRFAGVTSDCPNWLAYAGLEWLYRLCLEPRRLGIRYLVGNPTFALQLVLAKTFGSPLLVQPLEQASALPIPLPYSS